MGSYLHDVIVVTGSDERQVVKAKRHASKLGLMTTGIHESIYNAYFTFCVLPNGSKMGYSDIADDLTYTDPCKDFCDTLDKTSLEWAWTKYGHDMEGKSYVVRETPEDWSVNDLEPENVKEWLDEQ